MTVMAPEELHNTIKARPFRSLRLHLSDGQYYDVTHPDQVIVTRRVSYVGLRRQPRGLFQEVVRIDNLHVTRVEPLEEPLQPNEA